MFDVAYGLKMKLIEELENEKFSAKVFLKAVEFLALTK